MFRVVGKTGRFFVVTVALSARAFGRLWKLTAQGRKTKRLRLERFFDRLRVAPSNVEDANRRA
jgi:hypothetical protein